jgi:hypothetical protein
MNAARVDLALALSLLAAPALGQDLCVATVNGAPLAIDPAAQGASGESGVRERLLAWPGRRLNQALGRAPTCDSETLIAYLGATVPPEEIDGYCLSEQGDSGFILVPGERNFRGRCTTTACDKVNTTADAALNVAGTIATGVANDLLGVEEAPETGVENRGLMHASGAAILTGTTGYISANLGTIGSGLATALSTPAVLAASAVTVVAVGGAVYVCRAD